MSKPERERWRSPESSERTRRFWQLIKENVYHRRYREAPVMHNKDGFGENKKPASKDDKSWGKH